MHVVAQALAGLKELRRLKLFVDFVQPTVGTLQDSALVFVRTLPSLREVMIWDDLHNCHSFHAVDGCVRREGCRRRGVTVKQYYVI